MKSNTWVDVQLGDIVNFRRGHDLPKTKMLPGTYPVIGSNGIIGTHSEYKSAGPNVVIGRSGNIGKPFYYKDEAWPHNTSLYIDDFKGNNPLYIFYLLQTLQLDRFGGGSAVPTLNRNHIHPLIVKHNNDANVQNAISTVLGNLDKKIKINEGIIFKLEKISELFFKHWFIDFEFPNEEGQPYKSSGGKMVESELEMIPEGWEVDVISSMSRKISAGGTPSRRKSEFWVGASIPWIKTKEIKNNYIIESEEMISELGLKNSAAKMVEKNAVLVAMYGATAGQLALLKIRASTNQACCAIETQHYMYLYNYLRSIQSTIENLATGSAQQNLSKRVIENIKVIIPSSNILESFEHIANSISSEIETLYKENLQLEQIKGYLLPKLLSGEIEVPVKERESV